VFGDGSTRRDYTYIDDIIAGVRAAIAYDRTQYEIVNLGNSQTVSLLEMIAGIEHALGKTAQRQILPHQPGDVPQTWANVDKASRLLGYAPATPYRVGVQRFVDWFNLTP
jgi:UDP-glucuronate 4-epimerase